MRLLAAALALSFATPAFAGGIGVIGTGGAYLDTVYYYDRADGFRQYKMTQMLPTYGAGAELLLGDRDNRLLGMFRFYWQQEGPQSNPADVGSVAIAPGNVEASVRDTPRNVGVASVGLNWAYWGDPEAFATTFVANAGSGFLTQDKSEFFLAEAGFGIQYTFARAAQFHATVSYGIRYRKAIQHGPTGYAGIRYLFD